MEISRPQMIIQSIATQTDNTNKFQSQITLIQFPIFYIGRCCSCAFRFAVSDEELGSGNPRQDEEGTFELHNERSSSMLPRVSLIHPIYEKTTQK